MGIVRFFANHLGNIFTGYILKNMGVFFKYLKSLVGKM